MICFFEDNAAALDPIGLSLQLFLFNQRLWANVIQHLPVARRLATRKVDGIRFQIVDRQRVVFLRRDVSRPKVQSCQRGGPICEGCFVPGFRYCRAVFHGLWPQWQRANDQRVARNR